MNGFVKLHRQIKGHWVSTRSDWFQAWTYILMTTNYETGRVNLTEVYRELSGLFDNRAWRYLISKLEKDGMLDSVEVENLGDRRGFRQVATVTNWSKYHDKSRGALGGARAGASAERYAEQDTELDNENRGVGRSAEEGKGGASAERYAESNKNTFQEVQEFKSPPTPPSSESPPTRSGENYDSNLLQAEYPEAFRQLVKVKSISGVNTQQFKAWASRVLSDCRSHKPSEVATILAELAVNYSSFALPWKWYAKQVSTLTNRAGTGNLAPAAPPPNFERYEEVMTPSGVHTLLDVMPNGLVAFEDTAEVWKVHQIQRLNGPGAAA